MALHKRDNSTSVLAMSQPMFFRLPHNSGSSWMAFGIDCILFNSSVISNIPPYITKVNQDLLLSSRCDVDRLSNISSTTFSIYCVAVLMIF